MDESRIPSRIRWTIQAAIVLLVFILAQILGPRMRQEYARPIIAALAAVVGGAGLVGCLVIARRVPLDRRDPLFTLTVATVITGLLMEVMFGIAFFLSAGD